jgi:hypothetical protein
MALSIFADCTTTNAMTARKMIERKNYMDGQDRQDEERVFTQRAGKRSAVSFQRSAKEVSRKGAKHAKGGVVVRSQKTGARS